MGLCESDLVLSGCCKRRCEAWWQLINGKWYYFDNATAAMTTGWQMIGGKWYYLDPANGHMLTGRISVNGVWYSMAADGSLNSNK